MQKGKMERILMLVLMGAIAVYCNPMQPQKNSPKLQKYYDQISVLTKRVHSLKDEIRKEKEKDTTISLEDSLEAAVEKDKKSGKVIDVLNSDNLEYGNDVVYGKEKNAEKSVVKKEATLNKRVTLEVVVPYFSKGMSDNMVKDEPRIKSSKRSSAPKRAEKRGAKKPAAKNPPPKPPLFEEEEMELGDQDMHKLPFLDADMQDIADKEKKEALRNVKREEVTYFKREVNDIKERVHKIKSDFKHVKSLYLPTVKDHPLTEKTREMFEVVKKDIEAVHGGFHQLFTQVIDNKMQKRDEMSPDILNGDTYVKLAQMKDQLKGASAAIQELKDFSTATGVGKSLNHEEAAIVLTDKDQKAMTGVGESLHVEDEEYMTKNDYDGEMKQLNSLRDEVKDVIHKMKDLKKDMDKHKLKSA